MRSADLKSHAGQVSLPGGTKEKEDSDAVMTALREAEEEIGLSPDSVEVIGVLGEILLPSGFAVTPVVGLVGKEPELVPCPIEVDEIFKAPTDLILNPDSWEMTMMEFQGRQRKIMELSFQGFRVWGATATILHHLATIINIR